MASDAADTPKHAAESDRALPIPGDTTHRLVLIVDDLGHSLAAGLSVLRLPLAVGCAVLPGSAHGAELARRAIAAGHEVLLHQPMTPLGDANPGPYTLTSAMDATAVARTLDKALAEVPGARGLNNHMGSALTAQTGPMQLLMAELRRRGLYFVDSRTSAATVAAAQARTAGVPVLERNVFLDDDPTGGAIRRQWARALARASTDRAVVVIAHPYPETLRALPELLSQLKPRRVILTRPGELAESFHVVLTSP